MPIQISTLLYIWEANVWWENNGVSFCTKGVKETAKWHSKEQTHLIKQLCKHEKKQKYESRFFNTDKHRAAHAFLIS